MHKFSVGPFQGWLVGPMQWQVRDKRTGETIGTARNMSDCCRLAERFRARELAESERRKSESKITDIRY